MLQDVASYVIARTLGVIDSTKASTGGVVPVPVPVPEGGPDARGAEPPTSAADSDASSFSISTPSYFKDTVVEESDMKLSGAGAFSPFPSQPPSPTLSRRDLAAAMGLQTALQPMTPMAGRVRSDTSSSAGSKSASEESTEQFTMVDRDPSGAEGVQIRRRAGQQGGADDS